MRLRIMAGCMPASPISGGGATGEGAFPVCKASDVVLLLSRSFTDSVSCTKKLDIRVQGGRAFVAWQGNL